MTEKQTAFFNDLLKGFETRLAKEIVNVTERLVREGKKITPAYTAQCEALKTGMLNAVKQLGVKFLDANMRINVYGKLDKNIQKLYLMGYND